MRASLSEDFTALFWEASLISRVVSLALSDLPKSAFSFLFVSFLIMLGCVAS